MKSNADILLELSEEVAQLRKQVRGLELRMSLGYVDETLPTPDGTIPGIVCNYYKVPLSAVLSHSREKPTVWPRHVIFYLMNSLGRMSTTAVGRMFRRHHTAICYASKAVIKRLGADEAFAREVEDIKQRYHAALGKEAKG